MQNSEQVGLSLVDQSHWGVLIAVIVLAVNTLFVFNLPLVLINIGFGGLTGLLLLAYWRGKGGIFFILAIVCPLFSVLFSPLNQLLLIIPLVASFFLALCTVLVGYRKINSKK